MEQKKGFNLLRPQLTPEDRWDKIYEWVNSSARVIVIFVELIVITCFVVRVIIDRQARDLEKELEINKAQLDSMRDVEQDIRKLQKNLSDYANLWGESSGYSKYVEEIYGYSPNLFRSFNVNFDSDGKVSVAGVAREDDVGELELMMKNSDSFSIVELSSFTPSGRGENEPGEFQISAEIKNYNRAGLVQAVISNSTENENN